MKDIYYKGERIAGYYIDMKNVKASDMSYDNSESKLSATEVQSAIDETISAITTHVNSSENPHNVTKEQLGLDKVDNTADSEKSVNMSMQSVHAQEIKVWKPDSTQGQYPGDGKSCMYAQYEDKTSDGTLTLDRVRIGAAVEGSSKPLIVNYADSAYRFSGKTLDELYPVGSYVISHNSQNPFYRFGFGTWTLVTNRVIVGAGGSYTLGSTGGEATHTLSISEMPTHRHAINGSAFILNIQGTYSETTDGFGSGNMWNNLNKAQSNLDNTGGGQAHNNMQPYIAENIWRRDA